MDDNKNEFAYAISIGEGTLLAYGVSDMMPEMKGIREAIEENKDRYFIVIGPADGTGQ